MTEPERYDLTTPDDYFAPQKVTLGRLLRWLWWRASCIVRRVEALSRPSEPLWLERKKLRIETRRLKKGWTVEPAVDLVDPEPGEPLEPGEQTQAS